MRLSCYSHDIIEFSNWLIEANCSSVESSSTLKHFCGPNLLFCRQPGQGGLYLKFTGAETTVYDIVYELEISKRILLQLSEKGYF